MIRIFESVEAASARRVTRRIVGLLLVAASLAGCRTLVPPALTSRRLVIDASDFRIDVSAKVAVLVATPSQSVIPSAVDWFSGDLDTTKVPHPENPSKKPGDVPGTWTWLRLDEENMTAYAASCYEGLLYLPERMKITVEGMPVFAGASEITVFLLVDGGEARRRQFTKRVMAADDAIVIKISGDKGNPSID